MRVARDYNKNVLLKRQRGISFEDATDLFSKAYVYQPKNNNPQQYKAIGFVKGQLITLIVEVRHDDEGEYEWFVTL